MQREHPDVAELLTKPIWYFDRKGEVSEGQQEYTRQPIFYLENGGKGRVYIKWDPYYVKSLKRFSDAGIIPALTPEQERAATIIEETANRLALHMVLEVGDIQFVSNAHLLHARTAYKGAHKPNISVISSLFANDLLQISLLLPLGGTSSGCGSPLLRPRADGLSRCLTVGRRRGEACR